MSSTSGSKRHHLSVSKLSQAAALAALFLMSPAVSATHAVTTSSSARQLLSVDDNSWDHLSQDAYVDTAHTVRQGRHMDTSHEDDDTHPVTYSASSSTHTDTDEAELFKLPSIAGNIRSNSIIPPRSQPASYNTQRKSTLPSRVNVQHQTRSKATSAPDTSKDDEWYEDDAEGEEDSNNNNDEHVYTPPPPPSTSTTSTRTTTNHKNVVNKNRASPAQQSKPSVVGSSRFSAAKSSGSPALTKTNQRDDRKSSSSPSTSPSSTSFVDATYGDEDETTSAPPLAPIHVARVSHKSPQQIHTEIEQQQQTQQRIIDSDLVSSQLPPPPPPPRRKNDSNNGQKQSAPSPTTPSSSSPSTSSAKEKVTQSPKTRSPSVSTPPARDDDVTDALKTPPVGKADPRKTRTLKPKPSQTKPNEETKATQQNDKITTTASPVNESQGEAVLPLKKKPVAKPSTSTTAETSSTTPTPPTSRASPSDAADGSVQSSTDEAQPLTTYTPQSDLPAVPNKPRSVPQNKKKPQPVKKSDTLSKFQEPASNFAPMPDEAPTQPASQVPTSTPTPTPSVQKVESSQSDKVPTPTGSSNQDTNTAASSTSTAAKPLKTTSKAIPQDDSINSTLQKRLQANMIKQRLKEQSAQKKTESSKPANQEVQQKADSPQDSPSSVAGAPSPSSKSISTTTSSTDSPAHPAPAPSSSSSSDVSLVFDKHVEADAPTIHSRGKLAPVKLDGASIDWNFQQGAEKNQQPKDQTSQSTFVSKDTRNEKTKSDQYIDAHHPPDNGSAVEGDGDGLPLPTPKPRPNSSVLDSSSAVDKSTVNPVEQSQNKPTTPVTSPLSDDSKGVEKLSTIPSPPSASSSTGPLSEEEQRRRMRLARRGIQLDASGQPLHSSKAPPSNIPASNNINIIPIHSRGRNIGTTSIDQKIPDSSSAVSPSSSSQAGAASTSTVPTASSNSDNPTPTSKRLDESPLVDLEEKTRTQSETIAAHKDVTLKTDKEGKPKVEQGEDIQKQLIEESKRRQAEERQQAEENQRELEERQHKKMIEHKQRLRQAQAEMEELRLKQKEQERELALEREKEQQKQQQQQQQEQEQKQQEHHDSASKEKSEDDKITMPTTTSATENNNPTDSTESLTWRITDSSSSSPASSTDANNARGGGSGLVLLIALVGFCSWVLLKAKKMVEESEDEGLPPVEPISAAHGGASMMSPSTTGSSGMSTTSSISMAPVPRGKAYLEQDDIEAGRRPSPSLGQASGNMNSMDSPSTRGMSLKPTSKPPLRGKKPTLGAKALD